jgi:tripartite-type tricarboxylate transporter receptor subunit TctC
MAPHHQRTFVLLTLMLLHAPAVLAQTAEEFYRGKTISFVVSSSTGGGYDTLSRAIARYLPRYLPGTPPVVIKNMPGAGGIVATNHLFTAAAKDGTVIGGVQNNTPFEPLLGTPQAVYDPTKFNWLGSPNVETGILLVWNTTPVNSIDDVKKREITVGSSGNNSTPSFYTRVINDTLGTKIRAIVGYPGQSEAFLAMERGEIDGYPSVFYTSLMTTKPTWLHDKKVKPLLQYGPAREPELGDVPFILDLVANNDDRLLLEAAFAPLALGRPFLLPPSVPADRVAFMRRAFNAAIADPDFVKEAREMGLGVNAPRSGEEIQQVVDKTYASPPALIERLRKLQSQ